MLAVGALVTADGMATKEILEADNNSPIGVRPRRAFWAVPASGLRATQPEAIPVDLYHDPRYTLGLVHYLERGVGSPGHVWAVAELDAELEDQLDADQLDGMFFSPLLDHRERDGGDAIILAATLTRSPAQICLPPIRFAPGTLADQRTGRLDEHRRGLAKRALEDHRRRKHDHPIMVREHPTTLERRRRAAERRYHEERGYADQYEQRPHGQLEYRPCGPILSVR